MSTFSSHILCLKFEHNCVHKKESKFEGRKERVGTLLIVQVGLGWWSYLMYKKGIFVEER